MKEEAKKRLQHLAAELQTIVDMMTGLAQANGITSVPFLNGVLQFGVKFEDPGAYSTPGTVAALDGYHAAKGGACFTDWEWRGSHFTCFPGNTEREWLFGPEMVGWPKTDYED